MADYYRKKIRRRAYSNGEEFPSVRDIAKAWKVSPNTVRRALSLLKEEGLIDYSQGRQAAVVENPRRIEEGPRR